MKSTYLILAFFLFLAACDSNEEAQESDKNVIRAVEPTTGLPPAPPALIDLWKEQVAKIDYIFFNVNVSMATHDDDAARSLDFIESTIPVIPEHCKPDGRMFITDSAGETLGEIDFAIASGCRHMIIYVDGEARFANNITNAGLQQFANLLRNVPGLEVKRSGQ